jgi:hypothetical protein
MEKHLIKVNRAETFEELASIAIDMLNEIYTSEDIIVQICGPISTGGSGDIRKNINRFKKSIEIARKKGLKVFDQTPFEESVARLSSKYKKVDGYCIDILEIFYRRIFESKLVGKVLFLPDWQSSRGARWEREITTKLGLIIEDYPIEWLSDFVD